MDCACLQCREIFRLILLLILLLTGACRTIAPPETAFSIWQKEYQGIAMTAIDHSDGLNLFLPPAAIYFASKQAVETQAPQIRRKDIGTAREALDQYCQAWTDLLQRKLPAGMELSAPFSLPLPPWMMVLQEEDFQTTVKYLYQGLAQAGLSNEQKQHLQQLVLFHEQQRLLANVLNSFDKINRGQDCDLNKAVQEFRIFREFQQEFAATLKEALAEDLLTPGQRVDELLSSLLQVPQLETPLRSLPSLWMAVQEEADRPIVANRKTLQEWRDLQPEALRFAAIWEDLQTGTLRDMAGFTWLIVSFPSPEPDPTAEFFLISRPLPESSKVYLNGTLQPQTTDQFLVLELAAATAPGEEQLLAIRFANADLGSPLWPPWLVKQLKKTAPETE
ncbi:MAG: hypothetical protein WCT05_04310 [Lentisphaeria bacterium]